MMNSSMTFQEAREALEALALDILPPAEKEAVLAYLERSPELRVELDSLEEAAAQLTYMVRPAPLPQSQRDRIRSRLFGRVAEDRGNHAQTQASVLRPTPANGRILMPYTTHPTGTTVHAPTNWMSSISAWMAMAASIAAIAMTAMWYQAASDRDRFATAYATIASDRVTGADVLDSLRDALTDREKLLANLTGPQVAVVTLAASNAPQMTARMFWDQAMNAWTFIGHNLPAPKPGRIYQLWLVTPNQKINAGIFRPLPNGDAMVRATYALPRESLTAVAVTDEPLEGSAQPTTVPFIVGTRAASR